MMPEKERVKSRLRELIDLETEKALIGGELGYASELQEAKRLVTQEAKKLRKENPYIKFMGTCMVEGEGDPRERMKTCAAKWGEKSEEEKDALKTRDK
ncbi:unnamed protein product [marine sediment metagenome]